MAMTTREVLVLAQMLETALAVEDDAWAAAIDRARTHRPCDAAMYALALALGVPAGQAVARELIAQAYRLARLDAGGERARAAQPTRPLPTPWAERENALRELVRVVAPGDVPCGAGVMRGPVVQRVAGDPVNAELGATQPCCPYHQAGGKRFVCSGDAESGAREATS